MKHQPRLPIIVLACAFALGARAPDAWCEQAPAPALQDCNGNGVDDTVDIALGSSSDGNFDGVPDECQDSARAY